VCVAVSVCCSECVLQSVCVVWQCVLQCVLQCLDLLQAASIRPNHSLLRCVLKWVCVAVHVAVNMCCSLCCIVCCSLLQCVLTTDYYSVAAESVRSSACVLQCVLQRQDFSPATSIRSDHKLLQCVLQWGCVVVSVCSVAVCVAVCVAVSGFFASGTHPLRRQTVAVCVAVRLWCSVCV